LRTRAAAAFRRENRAVDVLLLADTHVPDFARALPPALGPHLPKADLILHAGDATSPDVLQELARHAPLRAVRGNGDRPEVEAWGAAEELELELRGVRVALLHDAGPSRGRPARLRRRFPKADVVVFGHSHIPLVARHEGLLLVNPGSPTWKRREPRPTVAWLRARDGAVEAEIVSL
jgi:putative phosphoesterase